jgi:hypothetical protein
MTRWLPHKGRPAIASQRTTWGPHTSPVAHDSRHRAVVPTVTPPHRHLRDLTHLVVYRKQVTASRARARSLRERAVVMTPGGVQLECIHRLEKSLPILQASRSSVIMSHQSPLHHSSAFLNHHPQTNTSTTNTTTISIRDPWRACSSAASGRASRSYRQGQAVRASSRVIGLLFITVIFVRRRSAAAAAAAAAAPPPPYQPIPQQPPHPIPPPARRSCPGAARSRVSSASGSRTLTASSRRRRTSVPAHPPPPLPRPLRAVPCRHKSTEIRWYGTESRLIVFFQD